jgi:hypothetical protein
MQLSKSYEVTDAASSSLYSVMASPHGEKLDGTYRAWTTAQTGQARTRPDEAEL